MTCIGHIELQSCTIALCVLRIRYKYVLQFQHCFCYCYSTMNFRQGSSTAEGLCEVQQCNFFTNVCTFIYICMYVCIYVCSSMYKCVMCMHLHVSIFLSAFVPIAYCTYMQSVKTNVVYVCSYHSICIFLVQFQYISCFLLHNIFITS